MLEGLREIALPAPIAYVPQTAGWAVVAVVVLALLAWALWRRHRRWVANAYRRAALAELGDIESRLDGGGASELPALVKRTALAFEPRVSVARLSDVEWLRFLDRTWPSGGFVDGPGRLLPRLAYGTAAGVPDSDLRALLALVRGWIEHHHAEL